MNIGLARYSLTLESPKGRTHPVFMPSLTLVALVSTIFDSLFRPFAPNLELSLSHAMSISFGVATFGPIH